MKVDLVRIWDGGYAARREKLLRAGKPRGAGDLAMRVLVSRRKAALNRVFKRMRRMAELSHDDGR